MSPSAIQQTLGELMATQQAQQSGCDGNPARPTKAQQELKAMFEASGQKSAVGSGQQLADFFGDT
jgi:hypothetical protein